MSETINQLQQLLADSMVFSQNVHAYHWNVQGKHFLEYHEELGDLYDAISADVDIYAERILQLGGIPLSKLSDYVSKSNIQEEDVTHDSSKILSLVLRDLYKTVDQLNKVRKAAVASDDEGTNTLMGDRLLCVQKNIWKFSASLEVDVVSDKAIGSKSIPGEPKKTRVFKIED